MICESKTVQPRSSSIISPYHGSGQSDQNVEETCSITARSDASADSFVLDASVGNVDFVVCH